MKNAKMLQLCEGVIMADEFLPSADGQGFRPQAFPGWPPGWTRVSADKLSTPPYNRICQVISLQGSTPVQAGTGWHIRPRRVVTAAHVVAHASGCRVRFAHRPDWLAAQVLHIPDGYFGRDRTERICSPFDVAVLAPENEVAIAEVPIGLEGDPNVVWAIGFHDGLLVRHSGTAREVGPFLAHNVHTDSEHSGCPLLTSRSVRGIHVGLFSRSQRYLKPPESEVKGYLNSAVLLDAALEAQLTS